MMNKDEMIGLGIAAGLLIAGGLLIRKGVKEIFKSKKETFIEVVDLSEDEEA